MNTQKISLMKLIEAELQQRVKQTAEPELTKIDMIVRLSEVRSTITDLQEARRKAASPATPPSASDAKAC